MTTWIEALKKWNAGKPAWCIPRKGSKEYDEVKAIMARKFKFTKKPAPKNTIEEVQPAQAPTEEEKMIEEYTIATEKRVNGVLNMTKKEFDKLKKHEKEALVEFVIQQTSEKYFPHLAAWDGIPYKILKSKIDKLEYISFLKAPILEALKAPGGYKMREIIGTK